MELQLTICKASEVVDLVKARDRDNIPFAIVISIEGPADGPQGRAPRLATEIGLEWTDRQIILACNDVETGAGVPPPELVQTALSYFEKSRPTAGADFETLLRTSLQILGSSAMQKSARAGHGE